MQTRSEHDNIPVLLCSNRTGQDYSSWDQQNLRNVETFSFTFNSNRWGCWDWSGCLAWPSLGWFGRGGLCKDGLVVGNDEVVGCWLCVSARFDPLWCPIRCFWRQHPVQHELQTTVFLNPRP